MLLTGGPVCWSIRGMKSIQLAAMAAILGLSGLASAQANNTDPSHIRASPKVIEGLRNHYVVPQYPRVAREQKIQGDVILTATIDKTGKIQNLRLVLGDPILGESAMAAVKKWRYRPYVFKGEPVEVETRITVQFRL